MPKITRSFLSKAMLLGAGLILSGCSFKPVQGTATEEYVLSPVIPLAPSTEPRQPITILVEMPKAAAVYDTQQMAYSTKPYQLNYFSYNQWADTPAHMLQPALVQTLQGLNLFNSVLVNTNGTHYDIVLNTHLLQLQQIFAEHNSYIQLNVRAQLINNTTHRIIATQEFLLTEAATENTPYAGVIAANKATAQLLQQIAQFCQNHIVSRKDK